MLSPNDGRNRSLESYMQQCAEQGAEVKIFQGVSIADPAGLNHLTFAFRNAGKKLVRVSGRVRSEVHFLEPGEEVQIGTQGGFPEVVALNSGL